MIYISFLNINQQKQLLLKIIQLIKFNHLMQLQILDHYMQLIHGLKVLHMELNLFNLEVKQNILLEGKDIH